MDRREFLAKARSIPKRKKNEAKTKLEPMEITLDTTALEEAIVGLKEALGVGIEFNDLDQLIEQLGTISNLSTEVIALKEAFTAFQIPEMPESVKVEGLQSFLSEIKKLKISPPAVIIDNDSVAKAMIHIGDRLNKLAEAIKTNQATSRGQTVADFIPMRRVVKVGNALVFDDKGSGHQGAVGGTRVPTTVSTVDSALTVLPVANADGSPIASTAVVDTIADGADVTQGAKADSAYTSGSGTVISVLKGIFSKVSDVATQTTLALIKTATDSIKTNSDTIVTYLGAVTETAPTTDTASSGLNGRLQRIAQRLTSLIGLLPTSLGQGTMASSLKVVLPSDQASIPVASTLTAETTKVIGTVNQGTSPWVVAGGKTNNNAAPGATNLGTLPAIANAAAPTDIEGNQVAHSTDLSRNLRTTMGTQLDSTNDHVTADNVTGNVASAATDSGNPVKVGGKYNSSAPSFSNGQRGDLQIDPFGNLKIANVGGLMPTGTALTTYAAHITTNTTTTPTSSTSYISSIAISIDAVATSAGTITIKDKSGTPLVLVNGLNTTAAVSTTPTILNFQTPIKMTSGIDIVTAASLGAATIDIWINYYV